ncbi:MAG TPA: hypothetical protein VGL59_21705 [Polyangia bacterium]
MLENTEEARVFEAMKDDLLRLYPGRFAVVCGEVLVGVFPSVDDALLATFGVFDDGKIPAGAPILISEIAKTVSVRVMATPSSKVGARVPGLSAAAATSSI